MALVRGDWRRGNQANPSLAGGCVNSDRAKGNRVATSSVRPAVFADGLPERVEPAAPLLMFNSYAAGVGKRPELVAFRSNSTVKIAKQDGPLRLVDPMGEGVRDAVLFLFVATVAIGMRLGQGFRAVECDTG